MVREDGKAFPQRKQGRVASFDSPIQSEDNPQPEFKGPTEDRQCRDVIFLLLFIAFLGGLGYVIYRSVLLGNPHRLWYGTDSWGNVCGVKNKAIPGVPNSGVDLEGKRHLFYFTKSYLLAVTGGHPHSNESATVCVSQCPNDTLTTIGDVQALAMVQGVELCRYDVNPIDYQPGSADGRGSCPPLPVEASASVFHRCVPYVIHNAVTSVSDVFNKLFNLIDQDFGVKCAETLTKSWVGMVVMLPIALVTALALLLMLRFWAGAFVWGTVILIALACLASIGACWFMYATTLTGGWLGGAIAATVVGVIILLILLVLRSRLALVVKLFKEAGKAVADMPVLLLHPFLTLLILGAAMAALIYAFLFLITAKNASVDSNTGFVILQDDAVMRGLIAYMLLAMLWVGELIVDCERLTVSSAVAIWYFTRDKTQLSHPICTGIKRTIVYHLGSVCFGSLIIALVALLRYILSFIEGRLKGAENSCAKFFLKCFVCCLWCFEKFLKFLSSNAYVMIAIKGGSFCSAAKDALKLIVNNALSLAAINCVGDFVLFLCKVANVAIVGTIAWYSFFRNNPELAYPWLPLVLGCLAVYCLTAVLVGVFEMCIDAIFICFCVDCEQNNGTSRPYFMSKSLMKLVKNK